MAVLLCNCFLCNLEKVFMVLVCFACSIVSFNVLITSTWEERADFSAFELVS